MKKLLISLFLFSVIVYVNAQNDRSVVLQDLEKNQPAAQDVKLTATLKSATRLFGEKDDLTSVILIIPSGSVVNVIGSDSTYLHVIYEEDEGYIFKRHAVMNEPVVETKPVEQKQEPVQEVTTEPQQQQQQQQVSRFTYLENKYGTNMAAKLIAGKIWKGMSSEMVRDSWGKPQKINRVIGDNIIREEWIYKSSWLYIENDFLVEWGPIRN
ncbi:MAG: hypothetical protein NTZ85_05420 [Bacteroidia bacterium]|nr:hypothetical protein [Bacteroidia bacterium]